MKGSLFDLLIIFIAISTYIGIVLGIPKLFKKFRK